MSGQEVLAPSLREAFAQRKAFEAGGREVPLESNVSEEEALQLYQVVRRLKPETSLEIGFAQGVSAQAILQALEENGAGHHHILDPFQEKYGDSGLEMVRRAGLAHRMTFHRKFAEEVIPHLPGLEFAFIDASHLFDLTLSEFVLTDKKLAMGGVIAFHDMWMPAQQSLIRYILANRSYVLLDPPRPETRRRPNSSPRSLVKKMIRQLCAMIPRAELIFRPAFLHPWQDYQIGNLVFLRKAGEDDRDWRIHRDF